MFFFILLLCSENDGMNKIEPIEIANMKIYVYLVQSATTVVAAALLSHSVLICAALHTVCLSCEC